MPLPFLLPHAPGETPVSFLSRLAMCNGTTAAGLASDLGISLTDVIDVAPDAIATIADHAETSRADLFAAGYRKIEARSYLRNGIPLPRHAVKSPTIRGCPACLREDAQRTDPATQIGMAVRADWQLPFLRTCPRHDLPIVSLWSDRNRTARHDVAVRLGLLFDPIMAGELDVLKREHSPFEAWVVHRINDGKGLHWFDAHDFFAAATFCELLGRAVMLGWHQKTAPMTEDLWYEAGKIGFDVCQRGEDFVRGMLEAIQKRGGNPQDGPNARFGPLHDRFSRDMTGPEFEPFRAILRDHIMGTWPLGPGDQVLGVPVTSRRLHSVRTASNETGIGTVRLRKALAAAGLVPHAGEEISDAWDVFDAAVAQPVLDALTQSMGASEAHEHFNFPRDQFEIMQDAGYFSPLPTGNGTYPAYAPADIQGFIDHLLTGAVPMRQAPAGCCDIPTASRKLNCSARDIVQLLHAGNLRTVGRHAERAGYLGIMVDLKELRPLIQKEEVIGRTLAQVGHEVGIRLHQVRALIEAGHLNATLGRNPIKKVPQLYVRDSDFLAFNKHFVGLKHIFPELGISATEAAKQLTQAKVLPLGGPYKPYGLIYRRDLVNRRFLSAWPRAEGPSTSVAFLPQR